ELVRVSDEEICAGLVILQEDAKLAVEPAAGAAISAAFGPLRERVSGQRVGIIICGANIDCSTYQELLARGQQFIARSA
ncbi:MAG: threonine/serine dehydratase, partial [Rhodobacteraceae bacterium]|nr:threonine/serine dehydratase [Paracoccaceae bacterium]